jgi:hypothetical protein
MLLFRKKDEEIKKPKTIMTIEIEKQNKDDKFSVFDLKMFHRECEQGKIWFRKNDNFKTHLFFNCQRCDMKTSIYKPEIEDFEKLKMDLIQVALANESFQVMSKDGNKEIIFVQKI